MLQQRVVGFRVEQGLDEDVSHLVIHTHYRESNELLPRAGLSNSFHTAGECRRQEVMSLSKQCLERSTFFLAKLVLDSCSTP